MSETLPHGELPRTPLYECHLEAGGKMVEFAGFAMPVQYAGVMEEHHAVRQAAGLFDVSHMGEVRVKGAGAEAFLDRITPNHVAKLTPGRAHYSGLLTEQGTYLDDLLIYKMADDDFLVVVNAANAAEDFAWMASQAERLAADSDVEVIDESNDYALLALQGPRAVEILARLTETDLDAIRYYRFAHGKVDGRPVLFSRTGYTGEDGFELYLAPEDAAPVWRSLLATGADDGLIPAGLGARDTLRLEAGMALYGHELDVNTTPLQAGLNWVVKLDQGDFLGRSALLAEKEAGSTRRLIGFEIEGKGIARSGHEILDQGEVVGTVTSGTWSPTFEKALGMAYVPPSLSAAGTELTIAVRKRQLTARVVDLPFYRRSKG